MCSSHGNLTMCSVHLVNDMSDLPTIIVSCSDNLCNLSTQLAIRVSVIIISFSPSSLSKPGTVVDILQLWAFVNEDSLQSLQLLNNFYTLQLWTIRNLDLYQSIQTFNSRHILQDSAVVNNDLLQTTDMPNIWQLCQIATHSYLKCCKIQHIFEKYIPQLFTFQEHQTFQFGYPSDIHLFSTQPIHP